MRFQCIFIFFSNVQIGRIVGISLGSLIIIGIIILIIVYLRRQWARSEENKLRLTARISGLDECEVMSFLFFLILISPEFKIMYLYIPQ